MVLVGWLQFCAEIAPDLLHVLFTSIGAGTSNRLINWFTKGRRVFNDPK